MNPTFRAFFSSVGYCRLNTESGCYSLRHRNLVANDEFSQGRVLVSTTLVQVMSKSWKYAQTSLVISTNLIGTRVGG
jgi:hypothetical protein